MPRLNLKAAASICLLSLLSVSLPALELAQARGKPDKSKGKHEKKEDREDLREVEFAVDFLLEFSSKDARRYATESEFIGQKPLPPGIRKNLARGKPIPPGIAKRDMPSSFLKKLPAHDDYEWHMAGSDLLLTSKSDKLVKEIVKDVFK